MHLLEARRSVPSRESRLQARLRAWPPYTVLSSRVLRKWFRAQARLDRRTCELARKKRLYPWEHWVGGGGGGALDGVPRPDPSRRRDSARIFARSAGGVPSRDRHGGIGLTFPSVKSSNTTRSGLEAKAGLSRNVLPAASCSIPGHHPGTAEWAAGGGQGGSRQGGSTPSSSEAILLGYGGWRTR